MKPLPAALAALLLASTAPALAQPQPGRPAPATPAAPAAQGIPQPLRGAWFAGDCTEPTAVLVVTARSVARLDSEEPAHLFRFRGTRRLGGWTLGTAGGAEAPRLLLRAVGAGLETAEPDPKTRDDRLPGELEPESWRRCATPPLALAALHGEGAAFLGALEHMEAGCGPVAPGSGATAAACAATIVAQADVSGDGRLSAAELARLARGAAWLAAVREGATPDLLSAAVGAGGLAGLLAARVLVESLDYDGDGRISAAELVQDRGALAGPPGGPLGNAAGSPLRLEGLAEGAGLVRGLAEGLFGEQ
ncbi:hypothetical protein [Falsiroseomonas sp. E2-1-a20]|uniref:hypothetical protein n=1 Tax=Falsiroseomonas sp. E2-1-a20 TaxID=3239300 RepID=UPI003F3F6272